VAASKDHPLSLTLTCHPATAPGGVQRIDVSVAPLSCGLALRYRVHGALERIAIPAPVLPVRRDGLWRHTCFEAFVNATGDAPYAEFNMSPSGEWAAYRFDAYRAGMRELALSSDPVVRVQRRDCVLEASVRIETLPAPWCDVARLRIGLTAVIEGADGTLSYWSLAHPPGRPDFHHDQGFLATLKASPECNSE